MMLKVTKALKAFCNDERGATAIEYGLFAALIAAVIVLNVESIGESVNSAFATVKDALPADEE
ncbi:pilus assembly protein Flp/PilA [Roseibaca calidilacus]|uniref:Pilus assembly protein Flp/PilA n=2 Tax=Roseibaca calidilacus TaxID=1666912 RepID=A0ABM9VPF6_9RHOB|nr:pilus assembly protein Flp/PilA [Roseibaca calidilacus]